MAQNPAGLFARSALACGFVILLISIYLFAKNYSGLLEGIHTQGKAIEYIRLDSTDKRYPRIRFKDENGTDHYFIDTLVTAMSKQQRTFDIIYSPLNPSNAMVYNKIDVFGLPIITFMTGIGCIAFGGSAMRINRKRQKENEASH